MSTGSDIRYTVDDLWDFPDDGKRRELIDGVLYVTPMARSRHQRVVGWLTYRLAAWVEEHGGDVFPGVNVDLDERTHLEPDVAFVRPGRDVGDVLSLHEPPDLVVEVSSPSTKSYDVGVKRDRYADAGAPEFWFVDLDRDTVLVSRQTDAGYADPVTYARGDVIRTEVAPGLVIDVDDILAQRG
ncbi:MAG: Uma2 family endonuclease [Actinomycetota bacterium]|nr:Uma2 family endonuclease [Actinomycetota bacterium]